MQNSYLLGAAAVLLRWCCSLSAALPVFATDEPLASPLPFACEVRYHFREHFLDAKPGQKNVSAPSYQREGLPVSRVVISDGSASRIVDGCVAHLPYQFLIKISRSRDSEVATLEVNVLDSSGKPVTSFPQVMPNPLTRAGDTSRKSFEIPVDEPLKKKIEKTLLVQDQFLTHVDLIVGMDEDFLSADFPK